MGPVMMGGARLVGARAVQRTGRVSRSHQRWSAASAPDAPLATLYHDDRGAQSSSSPPRERIEP